MVGATLLPDGLTLKWYLTALWSDPRFLQALSRSLLVCFGALLLSAGADPAADVRHPLLLSRAWTR